MASLLQQQQRGLATPCSSSSRACPLPSRLLACRRGRTLRVAATAAPEAPPASSSSSHTPAVARPDADGRYGAYGGKYVPETLIPALAELEAAYREAMADPVFQVRSFVGGGALVCAIAAHAGITAPHHHHHCVGLTANDQRWQGNWLQHSLAATSSGCRVCGADRSLLCRPPSRVRASCAPTNTRPSWTLRSRSTWAATRRSTLRSACRSATSGACVGPGPAAGADSACVRQPTALRLTGGWG
jgi:hypothetical protein